MKNLFLILFFLQLSVLNAQTTSDLSQVKWVNEADGLTQLYVNNCATDNNGFVWIATQLGLFRYNWREATLVKNNTYPNLSKQRISKLYKNPTTGVLYFSTSPEGKGYSIKDNEIRQLNENEGIFLQNDVFLNATHPLYPAVVKYYKVHKKRIEDSSLSSIVLTDSFFYMLFSTTVVILDKQGNTKVIPYKGTENATFFNCDGSIFVIDKEKIGLITRGTIDFNKVTADAIVLDYIRSKKTGATYNSTIYINKTTYINHKNNIYKILYKDNKIAAEFVINSPINEESAFSYSEENKVCFFFSSYQGMAIVKSNTFNTIYSQPNRFDFSDYAIVKKNENWYNYNGWIYNNRTKALKNRTITTNGKNMRFLLGYNNNYFYESKYNELVSIIDLKTKLPFKTNEDFKSLTSYTYLKKKLWLSYEKKIACLVNNQFVFDTLFNKALKSNQSINALNSINGHLIVATTKGVFLYKPFSGKIRYIKGLENVNARYIKCIDKSKFWVGCYGEGLYLVNNNKAHRVIDRNIDIATAHATEEDQYGNLWISTNNGLLTVSKQKAISNTLKKIPIESYIFTTNDGLPTNEFNGGSTFPSLQEKNGTIGFPSMKGFVWFHPKNVKKQLFKSAIIIDELLVDKTKVLPLIKDTYKISSDAKIITIKFDYGYAENLQNLTRFYKFENQTAWTEIKGNTIILPRYKKGSHKLQIKIKTHGFEDKYDVVKSVTLDFEPKYYEKYWFWTLILVLLLLLFLLMFQIGTTIQEKRAVELQIKIDEKTAQLSQNIFQLENANEQLEISKLQLSEALHEKEILLKEIHHRVKNNLQIIMSLLTVEAHEGKSKSIDEFLKISESRIQSMALIHQSLYEHGNLGNIIYQDYLVQLVHYLQSAMGQQNDSITFEIEAENIFLEIETAISLGLVLNELLTNTFKYAFPNQEAGEVYISIQQLAENEFELVYSDSGIGFQEAEQTVPSFGLELVKMLVKELKGTLIKVPFRGTKYCILFRQTSVKI